MTEPTVCVVGSVNIDTTLRVHALPGPGETVLASGRHDSGGGKGANQAAAAAAAGVRVALVGAVGGDQVGEGARESLAARGIDVTWLSSVSTETGIAVVVVAEDGENLIVVNPGANGEVDPALAAQAVVETRATVLLGQLEVPVASLVAAAKAKADATFVFNPAPMGALSDDLVELVGLADVVVPNRSELGRLAGGPTPWTHAEVLECLAAVPATCDVVVTLGSDGCVVRQGAEVTTVPAAPADVLDTSGAGDVFCGVLAAELARGRDLLDAVDRANVTAARSTSHLGAQVPADFRV